MQSSDQYQCIFHEFVYYMKNSIYTLVLSSILCLWTTQFFCVIYETVTFDYFCAFFFNEKQQKIVRVCLF